MIANISSNAPLLSIIAYSMCSGTLLVMNKMLTIFLPPAMIACIQFMAAVVMIYSGASLGYLKLDNLTDKKLLTAYGKYSVLFTLGVFSNMKALSTANVDTVIVFRSCVPLLVCIFDATMLGREYPSGRSLLAMLMMVVGAYAYVANDPSVSKSSIDDGNDDGNDDGSDDNGNNYFWVIIYFFAISAEMVFGKSIKSGIKCELGTSVILTNLLTLPAMTFLSMANDEELSSLWDINASVLALLIFSCVVGAAIGFSSWWCRGLLSATSFTIVGVANKFLSILLNIIVWDKHATPAGTVALFVCLAGGTIYKQAPLRNESTIDELDKLVQENLAEFEMSGSKNSNENK